MCVRTSRCYVSRSVPTAMIFIPSIGGISHNEQEDSTRPHCVAAAEVLHRVMVKRANR